MYAAEHARQHPDQPVFIMATSGEIVTFAEYEAAANRLAQLFRHAGLRRRDHVAFLMENNPRMLECEGAAERTGLYFTCINHYLAPDEVAYIVNDSGARLVVSSAAKWEVAEQLPARCPAVERWLLADARDDLPGPWEALAAATAPFPAVAVDDEQLGVAMLYSSGTTGQPKGILRPLPDAHPSEQLALMAGLRTLWQLRPGMVYLSPAPLYHSAPQASVSVAVRLGATSIVMEHFDAAQYLDLVGRYRVTHSQVVPTMFSRLLKLPPEVRAAADVSSLEAIIHAAAPCPVPVKEAMIEWWGPIMLEYYAATEGNGFTSVDSADWLAHKGHRRAGAGRRGAHPRRGRRAVPDGDAGHGVVPRLDQLRVLQRSGQDGRSPQRGRGRQHRRRRRLSRRRGLPLPHRPQELHDHLRRREHLSAGDREPPRHPSQGVRRGRDRRAQRGPRRGGQGDRAADARRRRPGRSSSAS